MDLVHLFQSQLAVEGWRRGPSTFRRVPTPAPSTIMAAARAPAAKIFVRSGCVPYGSASAHRHRLSLPHGVTTALCAWTASPASTTAAAASSAAAGRCQRAPRTPAQSRPDRRNALLRTARLEQVVLRLLHDPPPRPPAASARPSARRWRSVGPVAHVAASSVRVTPAANRAHSRRSPSSAVRPRAVSE